MLTKNNFRHQIQHYTGEMAKDTSRHLHELSNGVAVLSQSEQKNWRLNRERLHNDFTKALNSFQVGEGLNFFLSRHAYHFDIKRFQAIQFSSLKLKPTSYFQAAQRTAAQKEKEVLKKAKAAAGVGGGLQGPGQKNLIDIEEGSPQEDVQRKQQMLMQEEYDMEHLQERQRQINQLEVMMKEIRFKKFLF